jgi:hypothetical protein
MDRQNGMYPYPLYYWPCKQYNACYNVDDLKGKKRHKRWFYLFEKSREGTLQRILVAYG